MYGYIALLRVILVAVSKLSIAARQTIGFWNRYPISSHWSYISYWSNIHVLGCALLVSWWNKDFCSMTLSILLPNRPYTVITSIPYQYMLYVRHLTSAKNNTPGILNTSDVIGIDTEIEVRVAPPLSFLGFASGCGETQTWRYLDRKSRYQFQFCHNITELIDWKHTFWCQHSMKMFPVYRCSQAMSQQRS